MQDAFTHGDGTILYCDPLLASCSALRSAPSLKRRAGPPQEICCADKIC